MQNQLLWVDHCVGISDNRLSRQLTHGMRTRGGQRKRFKDTAKHDKGHIDINTWELMAAGRPLWCRNIHQAKAKLEANGEGEVSTYSPFHLAPHVHTLQQDLQIMNWVFRHLTIFKTSSTFRGTVGDDDANDDDNDDDDRYELRPLTL